MPLIFSFPLQGIRQIWISTKLQEVGSQHQYEGWTFLHFAMVGADMSYLWDICSELFGTIEEDELVPGQFDSPPAKRLHAEAEKEETKVGEATGVINPPWIPFVCWSLVFLQAPVSGEGVFPLLVFPPSYRFKCKGQTLLTCSPTFALIGIGEVFGQGGKGAWCISFRSYQSFSSICPHIYSTILLCIHPFKFFSWAPIYCWWVLVYD